MGDVRSKWLPWRRVSIRTSAGVEEARELVRSLPDELPPLLPLSVADASDIGFDDTPHQRKTGFRAARIRGERFGIDYLRRDSELRVWGRVEAVPGGARVHLELGLALEMRLLLLVVALVALPTLVFRAHALPALLLVGAGWALSWLLLVRWVDRMEVAARAHFPPAENAPVGPFR